MRTASWSSPRCAGCPVFKLAVSVGCWCWALTDTWSATCSAYMACDRCLECGGLACGLTTNSAGSGNGRSVSRGFLQRKKLHRGRSVHCLRMPHAQPDGTWFLRWTRYSSALQDLLMGRGSPKLSPRSRAVSDAADATSVMATRCSVGEQVHCGSAGAPRLGDVQPPLQHDFDGQAVRDLVRDRLAAGRCLQRLHLRGRQALGLAVLPSRMRLPMSRILWSIARDRAQAGSGP